MTRHPWAYGIGGALLVLLGVTLLVVLAAGRRRGRHTKAVSGGPRYDWPAANVQPGQGQVTSRRGGWVYGRPIRDPEQTTVMARIPGGHRG